MRKQIQINKKINEPELFSIVYEFNKNGKGYKKIVNTAAYDLFNAFEKTKIINLQGTILEMEMSNIFLSKKINIKEIQSMFSNCK